MSEISLSELHPILGKSSAEFSAWLLKEALAYYGDDPRKRIMAFAPLEHLIVPGRDRSEAECLAEIFRALGSLGETDTQTNFKSGLAQAFDKFVREWRQSGWPQQPVANSVDLLLLTGKLVGCSELVAIIDEAWPLLPDLFGEKESAWDALFDTVAAVATKSNADRIAKMAATSHFRDYMAPMAFLALCRADKKRFPDWLAIFRPYFSRLHQNPNERRYAYMTARKFAKWVDIKTVAELLRLAKLDSTITELEESDKWLLDSLVAEPTSPWELTEDYRLLQRGDINRGPIEILAVEVADPVREYYFYATVGDAWRKSINEKSAINNNSLCHKFHEETIKFVSINIDKTKENRSRHMYRLGHNKRHTPTQPTNQSQKYQIGEIAK